MSLTSPELHLVEIYHFIPKICFFLITLKSLGACCFHNSFAILFYIFSKNDIKIATEVSENILFMLFSTIKNIKLKINFKVSW